MAVVETVTIAAETAAAAAETAAAAAEFATAHAMFEIAVSVFATAVADQTQKQAEFAVDVAAADLADLEAAADFVAVVTVGFVTMTSAVAVVAELPVEVTLLAVGMLIGNR